MLVLFIAITASFVAVAFAGFLASDRLIKHEHDHHHEQWRRDGEPRGFFYRPPGGGSALGFHKLWWSTLRTGAMPEWVKQDPAAFALFNRVLFWDRWGRKWLLYLFIPWLITAVAATR